MQQGAALYGAAGGDYGAVMDHPALCPAFRVGRGNDREYGFAASRARRATRPTPSRISGIVW